MNTKYIIYSFVILLVFSISMDLIASQGGIAGRTASPSETNCTSCHSTYAINSGSGSTVITHNIPASGYVPSTSYTVNVVISHTGMSVFGLGFEALSSTNTSAGTLVVTNTTTMKLLAASNGRSNIVHKTNGGLVSNTKTFSFTWTAPSSNIGVVTFYTGAVAGNNNGNEFSDYVYTTSLPISPAANNTITTSTITGSPFCVASTGISIPFSVTGTFNSGNIFNAQLSDAAGSFTTPTTIGSLTATAAGTIVSNIALPITSGTAYRIRVVSTNPVATGTDNGSNLTIIAKPTTSNAGIDQSVCVATATLSGNTPTVGTGAWTVLSGTATITTPTSASSGVTGLGTGANSFIWQISNGSCSPSYDTIVINRALPPTTSNAGIDQTVCTSTGTLNGNLPSTGVGIWTLVSGTANINNPTLYNSTISNLASGVNKLAWTITNAPCAFSTDTVIINKIAALTVSNAGLDQNICGTTTTLSGNTATVGTGLWSVLSGTVSIANSSNSTSTVSNLSAGNNVLVWTISNGICIPSTDTVVLNRVNPPTPANAGVDQNVCITTTTLNGNIPTSGLGLWSVIAGTASINNSSAANSTVSNLSAGTNKFVWAISNPPCATSYDTVIVERAATLTVANAGLDQNVCSSNSSLSGNTPLSGSGVWSVISGTAIVANTSNPNSTVSGLSIGNNIFVWSISNGICSPTSDTIIINRLAPTTIANAGLDQTICTVSSTLNANIPLAGIGTWSVISGTGNITNNTLYNSGVTNLSVGINTFVWIINNAPCSASSDTIIINKAGQITIAIAGNDQTVCGSSSTTLEANTPSSGNGIWTLVGGSGTFTNNASPSSIVNGLGIGSNIFVWTISNGVCTPSTDTVIINKYLSPTPANAGTNQNVCSTSVVLNANIPIVGTGMWQIISGSGIISNTSNPTTNVKSLGSGDNIFKWVISSSPCPSSSSEVTITNCNLSSTIATGNVNGSPFCSNSSYYISVPFTITGSYSGFYSLELSDSLGNFNSATTIGAGTQSPINATIPSATPIGNKYRVRIKNSNPAIIGSDNGANMAINVCPNNSLITGNIIGSPFCNSTSYSVLVPFVAAGVFNGYYTAELSDSLGNFTNPIVIASGSSSPLSGYIPSNTGNGNKYRIRVLNSNPAFVGVNNGLDLSINTCVNNSITTSTINGSPFCENTSYEMQVAFNAIGSFSGFYTAQLSDANGSFANPTPIGMGTSSPINCTIPYKTSNGSNYRIRVTNSNPYTIGQDNGANLDINSCVVIVIDTIAGSPFCLNTSYNLQIPYKTIGTFTGPMIVELSNFTGNFENPITIGYGYNSPLSAKMPSASISGNNYHIRIRNYDNGVFSNNNNNDLSVNTCSSSGVNETSEQGYLKIYPNPSNGNITIVANYEDEFVLVNQLGQTITHFKTDTSNKFQHTVSDLDAGIYFILGNLQHHLVREKIVIVH